MVTNMCFVTIYKMVEIGPTGGQNLNMVFGGIFCTNKLINKYIMGQEIQKSTIYGCMPLLEILAAIGSS